MEEDHDVGVEAVEECVSEVEAIIRARVLQFFSMELGKEGEVFAFVVVALQLFEGYELGLVS